MKKCCFIIPYFGILPNYFKLFLKSCEYNSDFNWLLFTDDRTQYDYPSNFRVEYISFEDLCNLFSSKFDFDISLKFPYKLCDFKPSYGYVFEDYIKDYKAWGHCDVDMLFGHLSDFITESVLDAYDKIFTLGHLVIYKNTLENNRVFMDIYKGRLLYREVFTNEKYCFFDEDGANEFNVNSLFAARNNKAIYLVDHSLNINPWRIYFRRAVFKGRNEMINRYGFETEPYRHSVYLWDKGYVNRYYFYDHQLIKSNFTYIHLQKRKMSFVDGIDQHETILIRPNSFIPCRREINSISSFIINLLHTYTISYFKNRIKDIMIFDIYHTIRKINFRYES